MKKVFVILVLAMLPLLGGACASGGAKAKKVDRMALMEDHLARLTADIAVLQRQNKETAGLIEEVKAGLRKMSEETRTVEAKLSVKLDGIDNRLQSLSERVEDSELRISNIRKELDGLRYSSYSTRPFEENPAENPDRPAGEDTAGEQEGAAETGRPLNETNLYQIAYSDFLRGEYNLALAGMRQFLQRFPDAEKADDAQFYVGECLYNLGDYQTAVEAYDAVIQRYSDSQYVVSATYKKALSFLNANQTAQGVILLQQLIINYPDSNEARLARDKLRSLGLNP